MPFEAAGCGDRLTFSSGDLIRMGFFTLTGSIDTGYETSGQVDRIDWSLDSVVDGVNRTHFRASMDIDARSYEFQDLYMAASSMRFGSFTLEHEDLGYYDRVMAFCAEEMELPMDEYIDHHVDQWQLRWLEEGLVAGPEMVASYRSFLNEPGRLSIQIFPTGDLFSLFAQSASPARLLRNLDIRVSRDGQEPQRLDLRRASREDQEAVAGSRRSWSRPSGDDSSSVDENDAPEWAEPGWTTVAVDNVAQHQGAQVSITLKSGRERAGRLNTIGERRLIIEQRMRGPVCQHPSQQHLIGFICNIQGANGVKRCLIPMRLSLLRAWKSVLAVDSVYPRRSAFWRRPKHCRTARKALGCVGKAFTPVSYRPGVRS
ncbi:hypothetical protein VCB98_13305 [Gammaproteobacteria bacterium AB-CW1]|uniref:Uncharacterized protein n=1 Tax=Natronospira elongata TaxID=3110268 RepID=A0AAP6JH60_9GAMM|nr:hypothetical protein [Gammaproteobacteria bacterium AB-CW1]